MLKSLNCFVRKRPFYAIKKIGIQDWVQSLVDKRRFSTAGNSRYPYHFSQREIDRNILKIISRCFFNSEGLAVSCPGIFRDYYFLCSIEVGGCKGVVLFDFGRCSHRNNLSPMASCGGADIYYIIRTFDHVLVVFNNKNRVS